MQTISAAAGTGSITERLFALQDTAYQQFQRSLLPNVAPQCVIGVRTPALRAFAKEIAGTPQAAAFLAQLPHQYYEENNLHAFLIEQSADSAAAIAALDTFLPYVDNWATCDSMNPRAFKKNPPSLDVVRRWIAGGRTYTVRYALGTLMRYYLDARFEPQILEIASGVQSSDYYVNMMTAWFFATALAKQYTLTLPYLEQHRLSAWVHSKTIQKAVESYRITDEQKKELRTLKTGI